MGVCRHDRSSLWLYMELYNPNKLTACTRKTLHIWYRGWVGGWHPLRVTWWEFIFNVQPQTYFDYDNTAPLSFMIFQQVNIQANYCCLPVLAVNSFKTNNHEITAMIIKTKQNWKERWSFIKCNVQKLLFLSIIATLHATKNKQIISSPFLEFIHLLEHIVRVRGHVVIFLYK